MKKTLNKNKLKNTSGGDHESSIKSIWETMDQDAKQRLLTGLHNQYLHACSKYIPCSNLDKHFEAQRLTNAINKTGIPITIGQIISGKL